MVLFRFTTDEVMTTFEDPDGDEQVEIPDELYQRYAAAFDALQRAQDEIGVLYEAQHPWEPPPREPDPWLMEPTGPVPTPRTLDQYQRDQEVAR